MRVTCSQNAKKGKSGDQARKQKISNDGFHGVNMNLKLLRILA